jgi:hypothetical protein
MKGKELLEHLSKLTEEQLELPVYVNGDHGQSDIQAHWFDLSYTWAEEYEWDITEYNVDEDNIGEYETSELKQYISIGG